MEIYSKFDIGDEVYYLEDNRIKNGEVVAVIIAAISGEGGNPKVSYKVGNLNSEHDENKVFSSKKELKEFLLK